MLAAPGTECCALTIDKLVILRDPMRMLAPPFQVHETK